MQRSETKGRSELDLDKLRREIDDFAHMLGLTVSDSVRSVPGRKCDMAAAQSVSTEPTPRDRDADRLTTVLAWIKGRTNRNQVFGDALFGEPAWDMLLDLYANYRLNRPVTIGDLCVASRAPMSTALRWLTLLERKGLVYRTGDPMDRRRAFAALTADGLTKMEQTLDSTNESNTKLGLSHLRLIK